MRFLRDYWRYVREVNIRLSTTEWARHFGEEILKSPVNQVSLILGVVGIAGVVIGLFHFIWSHPFLPLVAIGSGALVLLLISMFSFHLSRRVALLLTEESAELERLLEHLMQKGRMTTAAIRDFLGTSDREIRELIDKAVEQGWLEQGSGTWKVSEAMKPILRRRLQEKREGKSR